MIILISLIIGLFLLYGIALLFNRRPLKIAHLFILFAGLFAVNLFAAGDIIYIIISLVIIGASAGYTFRNNKNLLFFIFVSSLSITFIFTFNHYYQKNSKNIDVLINSKERLVEILNEDNISESERRQMIQRIDETIELVEYVVPFAYFINAFIFSFFGLYFLKFILNKHKKSEKKNSAKGEKDIAGINLEGIERFKVTEYLIFLFIAGWFTVLLVDRTENYFLYMAGLNIALILSSFYLIQAFGIIKFFLQKKGMPFSIIPAIILSFIFFGIEYLIFILILLSSLGAIDFWVDFRKLGLNAKKS
ncbi:MAG: DUF2232 domain-containing protein [Spirochaetes bacterium]|nr:DUF2232 domain-containing protein [Spirochaetota bacterium]